MFIRVAHATRDLYSGIQPGSGLSGVGIPPFFVTMNNEAGESCHANNVFCRPASSISRGPSTTLIASLDSTVDSQTLFAYSGSRIRQLPARPAIKIRRSPTFGRGGAVMTPLHDTAEHTEVSRCHLLRIPVGDDRHHPSFCSTKRNTWFRQRHAML